MSKRRVTKHALVSPKPPTDPWDVQGWLRFLYDWKDDWQFPGGLNYSTFESRFILSVVPDGWIKHKGPTGTGRQRKDIGRGHAAFLRMHAAGVFDSLKRLATGQTQFSQQVANYFFLESIITIADNDTKFFPDFWQAVEHWRLCLQTGAPLLEPTKRKHEFMVLTTILEDVSQSYTAGSLRALVLRKFSDPKILTSKAAHKVITRLGIR